MAEYAVRPRERTRAPSHPGKTVRASVEAMGLGMVKVSAALGVSRQALYNITRDKNPDAVSVDMAVRLGALFDNGPDFWINMQKNYDLWHAKRRVDVKPIIRAKRALEAAAA